MGYQRERITARTIHNVELSIAWARQLQFTIDELTRNDVIDPFSAIISRSVTRWHWLPTALLALTCARFGDLEKIQLDKILRGELQSFKQQKTSTRRTMPNLFLMEKADRVGLDPSARIMNTGYNSLRLEIHESTPTEISKLLVNQNDATHIFRHLRASWMHSCGQSEEDIQDFFKHTEIAATREYIHEGLFNSTQPKSK